MSWTRAPTASGLYPTIQWLIRTNLKRWGLFYGGSKFHGVSLNRSLLVGPDLLKNWLRVLLRFRQNKSAVSADIDEMFLQVRFHSSWPAVVAVLCREDPSSEDNVFNVVGGSLKWGKSSALMTPQLVQFLRPNKPREVTTPMLHLLS